MSLLNGFNGQGNRPPARPTADQAHATPTLQSGGFQNPGLQGASQPGWGQPQSPQQTQQPAQQWAQPSPAGYAPQTYGHAPATQGHPAQHAPSYGSLSANPDPFAPSFEPYTPPAQTAAAQRANQPAYQPQAAPHAYQPQAGAAQPSAAQGYAPNTYGMPDPRTLSHQQPQQTHQQAVPQQWAHQQPVARGFDAGNYLQQPVTAPPAAQYRGAEQHPHDAEPSLSDWRQQGHGVQQHVNQGYEYADQGGYGDQGYGQPAGGEHEQQYAEDDGQEYEIEEPSRIRRPVMIAAALAGAILVGGGLAYGYKSFLGGAPAGTPPTVKSASAPAKTKPADAGGTQFAHTDSKIMGRLGDGAPAAGAPASDASEVDANGVRKVKPLVIGRDGSIQAPAAAPAAQVADQSAAAPAAASAPAAQAAATPPPPASVSVPGMMVVDALGPKANAVAPAAPAAPVQVAAAAPDAQKLVVTPPAPAKVAAPAPAAPAAAAAKAAAPAATGSIEPAAAAAAPKKPVPAKKVAAANDAFSTATGAPAAAAATAPATGGNGYVAVLASVPKSASSQGDALKRFADMQQKYSSVLTGKTPSVSEANLGAKGSYHRLVVGPPASREQANTVCSQLKAQGYADCWVTSY